MFATAAWTQLHGVTQTYQAAVLRGAPRAELEVIRQQAHSLLDANLDLNAEAAMAVRSILGA